MKKKPQLLPRHLRQLEALGENLKLARLRRNFSAELVAQRAGISRMTLNKIENGSPSVAMGNYFMVLKVLNLTKDFEQIAANDEFGWGLLDDRLLTRKRAAKKNPF